jgi:hypothetical protein
MTKSPAPIDSAKVEDTGEPDLSTSSVPLRCAHKIQYIQSLMLKWLNVKAGEPAEAVWNEIEDELKALAAPTPSTQAVGEPEKIAPVQGYTPGIPWSLHLEAYAAYSKKWSPQPAMIDLEGRNCRGGFGVDELDEFIPGWRDHVSEIGMLKARVAELEAQIAAPTPSTQAVGEPVAITAEMVEAAYGPFLSITADMVRRDSLVEVFRLAAILANGATK